ncbi:MAG: hypothetical protein Barrevirus8_10 [Barrevirus sp.]|uniref:Uncharacterized protein n=1 Tax=Barrevirus sp. TaxID=2487763 RepID=A0A3G4ZRS1_9VIRU|nr:MAG: hypothetical protein Barrevirus8_10 [Barrevirus sp.]
MKAKSVKAVKHTQVNQKGKSVKTVSSGKVNTFKDLDKVCDKLQNFDKILWSNDLPKDKKLSMDDILSYIQTTDKELINKYKATITEYKDFKIIGYCLTNSSDYLEYIYLLSDPEYKTLFISVGRCHPIFWYKFTTKKDFMNKFDDIYDTYSQKDLDDTFIISKRVFIGNADIMNNNIHDIENNFLTQKYTDKLLYGSLWEDYPFREEVANKMMNPMNALVLSGQAMRQKKEHSLLEGEGEEGEGGEGKDTDMTDCPYSVSVRTLFSKSLVTVYDYHGTYILHMYYNPITGLEKQITKVNSVIGADFDTDLPLDLLMTVLTYPLFTHHHIIQMKPLHPYQMYLLQLLIDKNGEIMVELEDEARTLLKNKKVDKFDDIIYDCLNYLLQGATTYKLFLKIIRSDDMKKILKENKKNDEKEDTYFDNLANKLQEKYNCLNEAHIHAQLVSHLMNKLTI